MIDWKCPFCGKIIVENIEKKEIKEKYVECCYCGKRCYNPNYKE